jgi:hypothetical protein
MSELGIDPDRVSVVLSVLADAVRAHDAGLPEMARAGMLASIMLLGGEVPEGHDD